MRTYLSMEKAFHGLFPRGQHPKTPRVFGVAVRRILRRQTIATVCYGGLRIQAVALERADFDTPGPRTIDLENDFEPEDIQAAAKPLPLK